MASSDYDKPTETIYYSTSTDGTLRPYKISGYQYDCLFRGILDSDLFLDLMINFDEYVGIPRGLKDKTFTVYIHNSHDASSPNPFCSCEFPVYQSIELGDPEEPQIIPREDRG